MMEYTRVVRTNDTAWSMQLATVAEIPNDWGVWFLDDWFWIGECARTSIEDMHAYSDRYDDRSCWIGSVAQLMSDWEHEDDPDNYYNTACCTKCGVFWKAHP
jgi:hypothetical protein